MPKATFIKSAIYYFVRARETAIVVCCPLKKNCQSEGYLTFQGRKEFNFKGYVHKNPDIFGTATILHESTFRSHESSESAQRCLETALRRGLTVTAQVARKSSRLKPELSRLKC